MYITEGWAGKPLFLSALKLSDPTVLALRTLWVYGGMCRGGKRVWLVLVKESSEGQPSQCQLKRGKLHEMESSWGVFARAAASVDQG